MKCGPEMRFSSFCSSTQRNMSMKVKVYQYFQVVNMLEFGLVVVQFRIYIIQLLILVVVYANLFLYTFPTLMGLIVAWQIKKRSSVLFSDCRILLLCNKHCQSVLGVVNWYSLSLFTACLFCNLREVVWGYFVRFYFKTGI